MNLIALHFLFSIRFFVLVTFGDRYILFYDRHNLIDAGHFDRKVKKNYIQAWYQFSFRKVPNLGRKTEKKKTDYKFGKCF